MHICKCRRPMTNFAHTAYQNGADASTNLTAGDLEAGDVVILLRNKEFEKREVSGIEDGILNPVVILDDGTEIDSHKLSDGDCRPISNGLYAATGEGEI